MIPLNGDPIKDIRRLRRGLRDVRDRQTHSCRQWAQVAFGGLASGNLALVLISHPEISRDDVWSILENRWPDIVMKDVGNAEPSSVMTVETTVSLARLRRGIEPLRIVIPPQMCATTSAEDWSQPMPMVF